MLVLEILSYLCFIVILSVAGLIRRATHHRACASRQVIKAVHWFEDGQSDEKVGEVMWQGASFGDNRAGTVPQPLTRVNQFT